MNQTNTSDYGQYAMLDKTSNHSFEEKWNITKQQRIENLF